MKRILSTISVLALLCCMLPMSAFAASVPADVALTKLMINVDAPYAGRAADFEVYPLAEPSHGARAFVEQTKYDNYYHGVRWRDMTEARDLAEGETFVLGHDYRFFIYVTVDNPFYYRFAPALSVAVNGTEDGVYTINESDYDLVVYYDFQDCGQPPADIRNVSIGGAMYPVAGEHPVFDVAVDEEMMYFDPYAGTAYIGGVAWYNSDTFFIMDEDDVFQEGYNYTMSVMLRAKDPYRFAVIDGESAVKATFLGFEAENITYQEGDPDVNLKVNFTFECASADSVGGGATEARLWIDYPVGGEKASYDATLYGDHCQLKGVTSDSRYIFDDVCWFNRQTRYYLQPGRFFETGKTYSAAIVVNAESIYTDETRLAYIDHGDGTYTSHVRAFVNGLPARVEPYEGVDVGQSVIVIFDFPACNDKKQTINDIELTDIDPPVVGETPDMNGTLKYQYADNTMVTEQAIALNWYAYDGQDTTLIDETHTFSEENYYFVIQELEAGALAEFLVNDIGSEYDGSFSVRGSVLAEATSAFGGSAKKFLAIAAMYEVITELPDPIDTIGILGVVPPVIGQRPCMTATLTEASMEGAEIEAVEWYENGNLMKADATFTAGNWYKAQIKIKPLYPYSFNVGNDGYSLDVAVTVDGVDDPYSAVTGTPGVSIGGDEKTLYVHRVFGEAIASSSLTGVTDYVELGDLVRPAPGQVPDFNVDVYSPYTQFGGVTWCELDDNGGVVKTLGYDDVFKSYTRYRAEIRIFPTSGRTINIDARGAYLNGDVANYYYLPGEAVTVYAEYDTKYCITNVAISNVQYPIPGKTPDTDFFSVRGVSAVPYANGSDVDWYYETNPGTSVAGFAKLDGRFKSDRRHQAYVQLEAEDGYWFATDNKGNLAVNGTFDGIDMNFAYSTDSYTDDGACNRIEMARTYERAQTVDGVFVDGMWLTDGLYMENGYWGVHIEDDINKENGYAYYKDGVLTLHNFEWTAQGDYNMIDSYKPFTIKAEGTSTIYTDNIGIASNNTLTLTGDGTLYLYSDERGVFAMNDVTVESGTWIIEDTMYEGMWLYSSLTVNGGTLDVYGADGGLYGDDWSPVTVSGGTVIARADDGYAIGWCNMDIASGATVTVGNTSDGQGASTWDGQTDFIDYSYVEIAFTSEAISGDVTGDGVINMLDVMMLYNGVSGKTTFTATQKAAADQNSDGTVNMMDVMMLYNKVSGK